MRRRTAVAVGITAIGLSFLGFVLLLQSVPENENIQYAGIGVVLLAILFAGFIVGRSCGLHSQNSKNENVDLEYNRLESERDTARSSSRNDSVPHDAASVPSDGLWEDEVIVAGRIPREKVELDVLLSRGGYGEVYRGQFNGSTVAIKMLLPETHKNLKQINAFLGEIKLMASLDHARIVQFIGVAWDSLTDLCVVTEYMEGGDLRALVTKFEEVEHRPHGFDHEKIKIAQHVAHALTYLHSLQPVVVHRDLKSKNILLDRELNAKLTDFGVSRERSDQTMTAGVGSSLWMAPEVMMGERYDQKADVFSFGIVLSELDSHALPYSQNKETDSGRRIPDTAVLQMVAMGRLRVQFSENAPAAMLVLGNECISVDPKDRPTIAEVTYILQNVMKDMNRGFLNEGDWNPSNGDVESSKKTGAIVGSSSGVVPLAAIISGLTWRRRAKKKSATADEADAKDVAVVVETESNQQFDDALSPLDGATAANSSLSLSLEQSLDHPLDQDVPFDTMISTHVFVSFTTLLAAVCIDASAAAACPEAKLDAIINAAALTCPEFSSSFGTLGTVDSQVCDNKYCAQLVHDLQAVGVGSCVISTTSITLDQLLNPVETMCLVLNPTLWAGSSSSSSTPSPTPKTATSTTTKTPSPTTTTATSTPCQKLNAIVNSPMPSCPELSDAGATAADFCPKTGCIQAIEKIDSLGAGSCIFPNTTVTLDTLLAGVAIECAPYWGESSKKTGLIIGIIAGVVAVAGIAGGFIWRRRANGNSGADDANAKDVTVVEIESNQQFDEVLSPLGGATTANRQ
ncbi:Tkl/drk protein kinase, variant, partial [Globisporangium splendens]